MVPDQSSFRVTGEQVSNLCANTKHRNKRVNSQRIFPEGFRLPLAGCCPGGETEVFLAHFEPRLARAFAVERANPTPNPLDRHDRRRHRRRSPPRRRRGAGRRRANREEPGRGTRFLAFRDANPRFPNPRAPETRTRRPTRRVRANVHAVASRVIDTPAPTSAAHPPPSPRTSSRRPSPHSPFPSPHLP